MPVAISAAILVASVSFAGDELSKADQATGWRLYSGADATGLWRGYKQKSFPAKGWKAENGELKISKGGGGGDLITNEQFADVEMTFDFKLGDKANSGVMWRVAETLDTTWQTGPEYQLLEDKTYGAKPTDAHSCAALYDLYTPAEGKTMNAAGAWNSGRVYLRNGVLQHWLNGKKVVEARVFDEAGKPTKEWSDKIGASKFKEYAGFGVLPTGSVAIQDHGDTEISFKNFRIRDLAKPMAGEKQLFNGKDLTGWTAIVPEAKGKGIAPESVWEVRDGVLVCKGNPAGYIRTNEKYKNFVIKLQWRFDPAKGAGNSGVLLRMVGEDKVWPKSVEAQLHSGNAGDFWNIDEYKMTVAKERTNGRNTKKTHGAERPLGEWNEYEIIVNKGDVILKVNGEELNRATGVEENAGFICLQSEGAEIHFKNIRIAPLD